MIIFFTVLGVLMLAGGGYAIYDGLPYLVLERGFTQVIIGTVITVAGVIVLALARVLSELRRVRSRLDALDEAGPRIARVETPIAPSSLPEVSAPAFPDRPAVPEERGRVLPAAIGLGAGALAGVAATRAAAGEAERDGRVGTDSVGENPETVQDEPDLFASHLAEWDRETEREDADRVEAEAPEPETTIDDVAEPEPGIAPIAQAAQDEPELVTSEDLAAVVVDGDRPSHLDDTDKSDEHHDPFADLLPPVVESEVDPDRGPEIDEPAEPEPDANAEEPKREEDEFGALRQSLSRSWTREEASGRSEPTLSGTEDRSLDEAGDWMAPAGGRREPWFEPVLIPPDEGSPASDGEDEVGEVLAAEPVVEEPQAGEPGVLPAEDVDEEPAPQEPEQAAASEEGVVGAYQVGDAHFTIFADGSIKARTKDGDYSFASMEELKAYLASEKSRLGG